ncbi:sensor histidine kinase [Gleimia sp. 6138-11-ORH1]|uniref:sensor histidine kinase n=1 Tax=Gleimia sp. 6138-11-ORH1 TaxID=2973937 RepID=UPI002169259E|nr:sensor histidine kinase [Gleimia sp. 6138-11-ORH1]MCS4485254.1 sensor histidine kinase [Gleimia sp. 6138-11-ORH1]
MQGLTDYAHTLTDDSLPAEDLHWLQLILSDWQVISDLAGADLVMWMRTEDNRYIAVAHARPATSSTVHFEDVVGMYAAPSRVAMLEKARNSKKVLSNEAAKFAGTYSLKELLIPVIMNGKTLAVITAETNLSATRSVGNAANWTMGAARILADMITRGEYPYDATPAAVQHGQPRVIDGAILIDAEGYVREITPNATSCLRRLGIRENPVGRLLIEDVTQIVQASRSIDETLAVVAMGKASWVAEIERHQTTITLRAVPLINGDKRLGAVLLTRDVSEMRRRELELMTKDATIREIHHRVKNNLQTVSALIRLQGRRSQSEEVKAALAEAERRVTTIATVHAALSQTIDERVDFNEVARQVLPLGVDLARTKHQVSIEIEGDFGVVKSDNAQALATVLTELVTNAVEHGYRDYGGVVRINATRNGKCLKVTVSDDGLGIEPGRARSGLGTQIVDTVVAGELDGSIEWKQREDQAGTEVLLEMQLEC